MPALIAATTIDLALVRLLAERLVKDGGEVRCYLEVDDPDLRNIGCKVAVGALDDEFILEAALTNVHTFIALFPDGDFAAAAVRAVEASGVPQTILALSVDSQVQADFEGHSGALCLVRASVGASPEELVAALAAADDKENNNDIVTVGIESRNEL